MKILLVLVVVFVISAFVYARYFVKNTPSITGNDYQKKMNDKVVQPGVDQ